MTVHHQVACQFKLIFAVILLGRKLMDEHVLCNYSYFLIVHFYAKPTGKGQGFHLRLSEDTPAHQNNYGTPYTFRFLPQTYDNESELVYPSKDGKKYYYGFYVAKAKWRMSLNVTVSKLKAMECCGYAQVTWISSKGHGYLQGERYGSGMH